MPDVENEMKVYIPSTRNTEKVLLRTDIWTDKKWAGRLAGTSSNYQILSIWII